MARLLGVEQEFEPPDRLGRGDAGRLVEIDPAVDLDPGRGLLPRLARARSWRASAPGCLSSRASPVIPCPRSPTSLEIPRHLRRSQQRVHARLGIEAHIQSETQIGSELEIDATRDKRAQFLLVALERLDVAPAPLPPSGITRIVATLRSGDMRTAGMVTRMAIEEPRRALRRGRECRRPHGGSVRRRAQACGSRTCGLEKERDIALSSEARRD